MPTILTPFSPAEPVLPKPQEPGAAELGTPLTETDAIRAGESAKINTLSATDLSGGSAPGGNRVPLGGMIESKLVIEAIDAMIPAMLVVLFRYGKMMARKTDFQLSAKERETLAPVVQACMDNLLLNFDSPWVALAVTAGIIYGSKVVEVYGTAAADRKNGSVDPNKAKQTPPSAGPAKPPAMTVVPPEPLKSDLRPWDETDVQRRMLKTKKSRAKCIEYLENNWQKKGGQL